MFNPFLLRSKDKHLPNTPSQTSLFYLVHVARKYEDSVKVAHVNVRYKQELHQSRHNMLHFGVVKAHNLELLTRRM